jgi:HlyD family secretion protein
MRKKIYWTIFLAISLAGIIYYFGTAATAVDMTKVGRGDISHTVVDTGYVQAADKVDIFAPQGGRIISLPVWVGQTVEKNQLLMVLQNRDLAMNSQQLQIQLNQANAAVNADQKALEQGNLELADSRIRFTRAQELYRAGAISQVEYDAARSLLDKALVSTEAQGQNLQSAQAQVNNYQSLVNSARNNEQELQVKSPISGTIMQLPMQQEEVVMYGTTLAQVASAEKLEIKVDLLSDDLGEVKLGQKVQITAPVLGDVVLNGEIIKIYPQAEEKTSALGVIQRRVPTIVKLDSIANLKPGYETRVSIITANRKNVIIVPREAVLTSSTGEKQVMRVINGRVGFRVVKTGLMDSKNIEIIAGLSAGDHIIKDASVVLKENARVK